MINIKLLNTFIKKEDLHNITKMLAHAISENNIENVKAILTKLKSHKSLLIKSLNNDMPPLLFQAINMNNINMVKALLKAGADIEAKDLNDSTALMYATDRDIAQVLLKAGANIEAKNSMGWTALMNAAYNNDINMVQTLLDAGADKNTVNPDGTTALGIATQYKNIDAMRILRKAGIRDIPSQEKINAKLLKFNELNAAKGGEWKNFIDKDGNCNGYAFLFAYYATKKKLPELYDMLDYFIDWDEDLNSLTTDSLPESLKDKFTPKNPKHVTRGGEELFNYFTSQLALFQNSMISEVNINVGSIERSKLYNIVRRPEEDPELHNIFQLYGVHINLNNVKDLIGFFKRWRCGCVDLYVNVPNDIMHAVTLMVDPNNGAILYYDSNFSKEPVPIDSVEDVVELIAHTAKIFNPGGELSDSYISTISAYQFGESTFKFTMTPEEAESDWGRIFIGALQEEKTEILYGIKEALKEKPEHFEKLIDNQDSNGTTLLMYAAYQGDINTVQALLKVGANSEAKDSDGLTAFLLAADRNYPLNADGNYLDTVKALKEAGADIEAKKPNGSTGLMCAASKGDIDMLKTLLELGANREAVNKDGLTAMMLATRYNHPDIVNILKWWEVCDRRIQESNLPEIRRMLDIVIHENDIENLHIILAALKSNKPLLRDALNAIDNNGLTALMYGNGATVKILLDAGADIEIKNPYGFTALMIACQKCDIQMVQALLAAGADKEAKEPNGWTAFMLAAELNYLDILKILKEAGADSEAKDPNGFTMLMRAAGNGDINMVQILLKAGANSDTVSSSGVTAMMLATQNNHPDIVKLLKESAMQQNVERNVENQRSFLPMHESKKHEIKKVDIETKSLEESNKNKPD